MKRLIFLILAFTLFFVSCSKHSTQKYKYRIKGHIYNSVDTMPFTNTRFKLYNWNSSLSTSEIEETYFYTDSKGYFDFTAEHGGMLVWPSYFKGAAYTGPPNFEVSGNYYTDEVNKVYVTTMDTLYTTPYH